MFSLASNLQEKQNGAASHLKQYSRQKNKCARLGSLGIQTTSQRLSNIYRVDQWLISPDTDEHTEAAHLDQIFIISVDEGRALCLQVSRPSRQGSYFIRLSLWVIHEFCQESRLGAGMGDNLTHKENSLIYTWCQVELFPARSGFLQRHQTTPRSEYHFYETSFRRNTSSLTTKQTDSSQLTQAYSCLHVSETLAHRVSLTDRRPTCQQLQNKNTCPCRRAPFLHGNGRNLGI